LVKKSLFFLKLKKKIIEILGPFDFFICGLA